MNLLWVALLAAGYARPEILVETEWLAEHLHDPGIRIVDLRRGGLEDYAQGHVPGAVNLLNGAIRDPENPPTFLPSQQAFEKTMGGLGIGNDTRVVVYDERGGIYASRLWWILNYFGHERVALLNGGWVKWSAEGRPAATGEAPAVPAATFTARPHPRWLATADDVLAAIGKPGTKIVDARTTEEIEGRELRGIRRGGFIPSSIPVYWEDTFEPRLKTILPAEELRKLFSDRGILPEHKVIAYCQVGMRASHDLFALYLLGYDNLQNYYGSWEEWGNREELPIATLAKPPEPDSPLEKPGIKKPQRQGEDVREDSAVDHPGNQDTDEAEALGV